MAKAKGGTNDNRKNGKANKKNPGPALMEKTNFTHVKGRTLKSHEKREAWKASGGRWDHKTMHQLHEFSTILTTIYYGCTFCISIYSWYSFLLSMFIDSKRHTILFAEYRRTQLTGPIALWKSINNGCCNNHY